MLRYRIRGPNRWSTLALAASLPDVFLASRVAVSDRNLQALVAPSRGGCHVLVADSSQTLKRVEAMLL